MEIEQNKQIPFLDVLVNNNDTSIVTSVYHKKTYTGLLLNYISFTPSTYKIGLIRTLIDRAYKINNTWTGFDKDVKKLSATLEKNSFPTNIINTEVKNYLSKAINSTNTSTENDKNGNIRYFKLPYIGYYSSFTKSKILKLSKNYCKDINVKLVFTSSKLSSNFCLKDPIPESLKALVIYKFTCASCNASYIGETTRHLTTRIKEHFRKKDSHIYMHLDKYKVCKAQSSASCFSVIDTAPTEHQLKIKEGLQIKWNKPTLNRQVKHFNIGLTV